MGFEIEKIEQIRKEVIITIKEYCCERAKKYICLGFNNVPVIKMEDNYAVLSYSASNTKIKFCPFCGQQVSVEE